MLNNLIEKIYAANPSADEIYNATKVDPNKYNDFIAVFTKILDWIVWIGAVLIFIYLLISGITYITAGGNAEQAKKGQQGIIYGIIGILVMALSLVIIRVVASLFK